ncbi:Uncharacterised protein [Mycobacteroides abscessus subsp. abscessus]|nr:Uncharacterised protein [Mycobacteroides abscessus subsp. abscessus]SIE89558.1 Uncharacterised protein [Mycobacteroides abscessus subsp. abscessus]SII35428.1 Uncharacterised protein [Mycobacteroides abscessus subsp. abscessus]
MSIASSKPLRRQAFSQPYKDAGASVYATGCAVDVDQLTDEDLAEMVLRNVDERTRETSSWAAVTCATHIDRTLAVLRALHRDNLGSMQTRKAEHKHLQAACAEQGAEGRRRWLQARADYEQWRAAAAAIDGAVTRAMSAVNMARKDRLQEATEAKRLCRGVIRDLALAIHRHRDVTTAMEGRDSSSPADLELWGLLEQISVPMGPGDQPFTLEEMVSVWLHPAPPAHDRVVTQ